MQRERINDNAVTHAKKILFLIDELNVGGTEKQLIWLCEKLPRSVFSPTIGVLRKSLYQAGLNLATPVVNFNWQGTPLVKNLQLIGRLRRYLIEENFDILQTQFVESEIYGSLAALCCPSRPMLISTRRNLYHWITEDPWRFRIGRYLTRHVDHVLVNSYAVQKMCAELEGVPAQKITVIQNGVETRRFQNGEIDCAKEALGFSTTDFVVGVVGNWRPVKGLKSFLAAAQRISAGIPAARFVLAGQGPQEQDLRDVAEQLGIESRISFIRNATDVPGIIAAMDVAVQSSLSESFSNVLLEYMAAGKTIVATRVGDAPVMIKNGVSGLLVAPEEPEEIAGAVLTLFKNRDKAQFMAEQARESVEDNWSEAVILTRYQQFYGDLLTDRRLHGRDA